MGRLNAAVLNLYYEAAHFFPGYILPFPGWTNYNCQNIWTSFAWWIAAEYFDVKSFV